MIEQLVTGVVGVLSRRGRFLAIQRAANIPAGGQWCFPGGAVQPPETQAQAIQREMAEEVGLTVRAQRPLWRWKKPEKPLELHWWLVREEDESPLILDAAEVADAAWLTLEDIAQLDPLIDGNRHFLQKVFAGQINLDA